MHRFTDSNRPRRDWLVITGIPWLGNEVTVSLAAADVFSFGTSVLQFGMSFVLSSLGTSLLELGASFFWSSSRFKEGGTDCSGLTSTCSKSKLRM
jgi:ABC-type uncharacterized transport system permease subunit